MRRVLVALAALAVVAVVGIAGAAQAGEAKHPELIRLPDGFRPEGIAIKGNTFYVGSIPTGAIYRGNLRTGEGAILVPGAAPDSGKAAIGLDYDRGRLFVAGGPTGKAFVYDARTGAELATYQLTTAAATFVNDVVVTKDAAWFTDSLNQVLYRVPLGPGKTLAPQSAVQTIPLTGDLVYTTGFNLNGIDARRNGKLLVVVQSNTGKLFTVTPTGVTRQIDLGGATVVNGDGILLAGKTLYVVQNRDNKIAKIRLSPKLESGRIVGYITSPHFDVPTTVARKGSRLYLPNARFTTPPTATTRYDVVQVRKR